MDIYLISYHIILIRKNMTTYKYIRAKQRKENVKSKVFIEVDNKKKSEENHLGPDLYIETDLIDISKISVGWQNIRLCVVLALPTVSL